jgi:hypothetical protein
MNVVRLMPSSGGRTVFVMLFFGRCGGRWSVFTVPDCSTCGCACGASGFFASLRVVIVVERRRRRWWRRRSR